MGHLFQGRFKSVLLHDETALDEVGRYLHLNPVRVRGLGLSKENQRRARVLGVKDPGHELIARRLACLRDYPWSSWRGYSGLETPPTWLCRERLQGGCGGRSLKEQRRALCQFTEAPIRQGHLESPWAELIGGVILGAVEDAQRVWKQARADRRQQTAARRLPRDTRPSWTQMVEAAERILGRRWAEMTQHHGDWGRDGLLAVATRHLGWRLAEVVEQVPGLSYAAAAQGSAAFGSELTRRKRWRLSSINSLVNCREAALQNVPKLRIGAVPRRGLNLGVASVKPPSALPPVPLHEDPLFRRLVMVASGAAMGGVIASLTLLQKGPVGFAFHWTYLALPAFVLGVVVSTLYWRIVFRYSAGAAAGAGRRILFTASLIMLVLGVVAFLYPVRFIPQQKRADVVIGLSVAVFALSTIGYMIHTIVRWLEQESEPPPDEGPKENDE
ncbi:MAG TPA: hypothetical protein PLX89_04455 [Verrucomicrobiota bacterium]|nr:hypothetical protein [Verrucomicrobiota bacterium]